MKTLNVLRRPEVERRTGLSRAALYRKLAAGTFPPPIRLSERAVGWIETEVTDWIAARIAERGASRRQEAAP